MIVEKEIDPIFEATAVVDQMRTDARYPNYPAVLFRKIKGSSIPLLINLQGTYERLALAIDSNLQGMVEEFGGGKMLLFRSSGLIEPRRR